MFAAVTDYGNYAFRWTAFGKEDFRLFVAGLAKSPYYLLEKVAPNGEVFDQEKTIKRIKEHILEYRWDRSYTKEFAKREWGLFTDNDFSHEYEFYEWYMETSIADAGEFAMTSYPPNCMAFATKLIPRLAAVLRQELEVAA